MVFQCDSCGFCCRHLRRKMGDFTLGLLLLPDEIRLFPVNHLSPMWGVGLKGRSRPRPAVVGVVQLDLNVCPHITRDNRCDIYEKRPQICRAHPLTMRLENSQVVSASYSKECHAVKGVPSDREVILTKFFSEEMIQASAGLNVYYENMFKESGGLLWLYDLKSKKWKRVDMQLVKGHLDV